MDVLSKFYCRDCNITTVEFALTMVCERCNKVLHPQHQVSSAHSTNEYMCGSVFDTVETKKDEMRLNTNEKECQKGLRDTDKVLRFQAVTLSPH